MVSADGGGCESVTIHSRLHHAGRWRQWKIYVEESSHCGFAISQPIGPHSRVAAHGREQLPPAGNGTERDLQHGRGCVMFFLLRMAFWLGLVLVLLPREKSPDAEKLPQIKAQEAVQAATAAVSDMSQFCKRQPQACEVGGQAATVIGHRAQEGARKIYQIITEKPETVEKPAAPEKLIGPVKPASLDKRGGDHTGSIDAPEPEDVSTSEAPADTLSADDVVAEWRLPPTL